MSEPFDTFRPPPAAPDPWTTATEPHGEKEAALDPRDAAALLRQATALAERRLEIQPPVLLLAGAATVVVAYGAVFLSVRHQHPYTGPTGTALAVLYGALAVWIVLVTTVTRRALGGRSSRRRRLEGMTFAAIWICVYVFQAALHHVDPNPAIAYGIYPAVAPLVVVGAAAAGYEAARENRGRAVFAATAVALGSVASFAGPARVWAVVGAGLCVLLLLGAAAHVRDRRA